MKNFKNRQERSFYFKYNLWLNLEKNKCLLKKSGKLFLEIGFTQTREVLKILQLYGFYNNRIIKDLGKKK